MWNRHPQPHTNNFGGKRRVEDPSDEGRYCTLQYILTIRRAEKNIHFAVYDVKSPTPSDALRGQGDQGPGSRDVGKQAEPLHVLEFSSFIVLSSLR